MAFVLAGALVLVFVLGMGYAFTQANPATLVRSLRYVTVGVLALLAVVLALTERIGLAVLVGTAAWSLLTQGRLWPGGWPHYGQYSWTGGASRGGSQNRSSTVRTEWVALELDHVTGDMDGEVLKGQRAGSRLSALSRDALIGLYRETQADEETRRLLEAYLDRRFGPSWREPDNGSSSEGADPRRKSGMSREEAYEVLGLKPGASESEIRAAHRKLMLQLHPDKGGTSYLAAKINEAKDVLLRGA